MARVERIGVGEHCPLEQRYRRLLRVLPPAYRAAHEQAMVEAFLQASTDDDSETSELTRQFGRPGVRESLAVVLLTLRLRFADPQAPPRFQVTAFGLRFATLGCLTVLAVTAAAALVNTWWFAVATPAAGPDGSASNALLGHDLGAWPLLQRWAFVLWVPALISVVTGGPGGALSGFAIGAIPTTVTVVSAVKDGAFSSAGLAGVAFALVKVAVLVGLVAMVSSQTEVSAWSGRSWLLAAAAGFCGLEAFVALASRRPASPAASALRHVFVDTAGIWCAATVLAGLLLVARWSRGSPVHAATLLGVCGLAAAAAVLRAASLAFFVQHAQQGGRQSARMLASVSIQLALAVAVGVVAATAAAPRVRRMPPVSYRA